jgi:hypothetical protein
MKQQCIVYTWVNYMDFGPLPGIAPAIELAAAKGTDGEHEPGVGNLFVQREKASAIEIVRPVRRERVSWSAENMAKHRHRCRVRGKVGVDVLDAFPIKPAEQNRCLQQVSEIPRDSAIRSPANTERQPERVRKMKWPGNRNAGTMGYEETAMLTLYRRHSERCAVHKPKLTPRAKRIAIARCGSTGIPRQLTFPGRAPERALLQKPKGRRF